MAQAKTQMIHFAAHVCRKLDVHIAGAHWLQFRLHEIGCHRADLYVFYFHHRYVEGNARIYRRRAFFRAIDEG